MKRCLVTGAAAGIGRALALELSRAGFFVHGVDVDAAAGAATASELEGPSDFTIADLASDGDVARAAAELVERPPFDWVVHNAGINAVGAFARSELEPQRRVMAINLLAPLLLTAELLRAERIARGGSLVFVSSLSRFVGYPGAACYAASKDGLASYARSLSVSLAPRGIHVLTVYPGPTRTEHARRHSPPGSSEAKRMPPEELAVRIRRAVEARKRVLIPGAANRFSAALGHVAPRVAERAMKKLIFDKLPSAGPATS